MLTKSKMRVILIEWGICVQCGEEIKHHGDEPFASCKCGTREWTGELSNIQKLREEISSWRDWYANCRVDLCYDCTCDDYDRVEKLKRAMAATDAVGILKGAE